MPTVNVIQQPVPASERAKLARCRRRNGLKIYPVELRDDEAQRLVQLGWLPASKVSDRAAVGFALGCLIEALSAEVWPHRS